jgi:hypothetical protein
VLFLLALLLAHGQTGQAAAVFKTPMSQAEMTGKQAVVNTTAGAFVIDLRPDPGAEPRRLFHEARARRRL